MLVVLQADVEVAVAVGEIEAIDPNAEEIVATIADAVAVEAESHGGAAVVKDVVVETLDAVAHEVVLDELSMSTTRVLSPAWAHRLLALT